MTNSLGDLLQPDKFKEPPEVQIIKDFIIQNFQQTPVVGVLPGQITISIKGAALAGTLRMRLPELKALCNTDKKLIIRII